MLFRNSEQQNKKKWKGRIYEAWCNHGICVSYSVFCGSFIYIIV
ncbi:hypothetical protein RUMGNA_02290 [Mediterraneibacter gnavus ATCC 29149]|uniref:Uncharacterized protein n=1 Tax=Mediterraneibacter gnavus (strain ATCC 29149 / DSM 114966 / JCM 6515 / VPI C7-9) TaxID=411470 RepID=A7B407_MEDG7|nr:hypothetical protein RUMGNA_02290 [Mediterraneibacter gnavus ATCC 29149]